MIKFEFWLLLFIQLNGTGQPKIEYYVHDTMLQCFEARDELVWIYNLPKANYAARCMRGTSF